MSTTPGAQKHRPSSSGRTGPTSQRILSCVVCQQRKIKCDRTFPCGNCIKYHVNCVPATQTRQRKRRFPERELLERVRAYEDLLRRNNVAFEPLHGDDEARSSPAAAVEITQLNTPSPTISTNCGSEPEVKNIWYATSRGDEDDSDGHDHNDFLDAHVRDRAFRQAWEGLFDNDNYLLFGLNPGGMDPIDRLTLHPPLVQILRLWQVYLDNVNPLFKVTHAPSLQVRIIEAAANLKNLDRRLEALMFAIYSVATGSLTEDESQAILNMPKKDALRKFQCGCQQSLLASRFLQTGDRDCLTAYFLYLCSMRAVTDPRSLSPMVGIAVRIAQRMGLHRESALARCAVFEAEMRRRLWWAIVFFDTRIGQLSHSDSNILGPAWDCKIPLNVNDSEMRPGMKEPPILQGKGTDAVFAVTRAELGDWVRNAPFHLDFTNPELKPIARKLPGDGDLDAIERKMESEYLSHLDQGNPIHFMATWTARGHVAKCRIIYNLTDRAASSRTEAQRDASMAQAFRMLECDTQILSSPMTKGFLWFLHYHFPFPAYINIVQELRRKPLGPLADRAWEVMYRNYDARFGSYSLEDHPMMSMFAHAVTQAWETLQRESQEAGRPAPVPKIIAKMEQQVAERENHRRRRAAAEAVDGMDDVQVDGMDMGGFQAILPMEFSGTALGYGVGYNEFSWMGAPLYLMGDTTGVGGPAGVDLSQLDLSGPTTRWS